MLSSNSTEIYISVDIESAGPDLDSYALLSIGACVVDQFEKTFYVELKPDRENFSPAAQAIHGLHPDYLKNNGIAPLEAIKSFEDWVQTVAPTGCRPVFVGFNAAYDWMFTNEYFYRYLGRNPFGHAALDIKSFYMGLSGCQWVQTSMKDISLRYLDNQPLSHNALQDAITQGKIFSKLLAHSRHNQKGDAV